MLWQRDEWSGPSLADLKVICLIPRLPSDQDGITTHETLKALPLASLAVLSLSIDSLLLHFERWDHASWLSLLIDCSAVKHLQLITSSSLATHTSSGSYIELLIALSLAKDDREVHHLMPDLHTLSLVDIDAETWLETKYSDQDQESLVVTVSVALHLVIASRRWGEDAVRIDYTGAAWQRRYFNAFQPRLEADSIRLASEEKWLARLDDKVAGPTGDNQEGAGELRLLGIFH
ncbi:unnamed protein product [Peniophora sp. CBMAI 1063]|nr:unnamed protein product [Peniophora sp. CBMAI 1063]